MKQSTKATKQKQLELVQEVHAKLLKKITIICEQAKDELIRINNGDKK